MKLLYTAAEIEAMPQEIKFERNFEGTPFSIKGFPYVEESSGTWGTTIIAIYRNDSLIGGYRRLYRSFGAETFAPFKWEGVWYALYSANYTCTRALRLNEGDLEDWCGEEGASNGFCPTEFYLPQSFKTVHGKYTYFSFENSDDYSNYADFVADAALEEVGIEYPGFGFFCGCVWGDDSDWKLRYVDYSNIGAKKLILDDRFGYHPLPNQPLAKCIDLSAWEPAHPVIMTSKRTVTVAHPPAVGATI